MGWRTIEAAPTDGAVVWGAWPGFDPKVRLHVMQMEYRTDWWWPLVGAPYTGWCAVGSGATAKEPTHWMPLSESETPPDAPSS